jgi:hypothetical protein
VCPSVYPQTAEDNHITLVVGLEHYAVLSMDLTQIHNTLMTSRELLALYSLTLRTPHLTSTFTCDITVAKQNNPVS